ncbi:E2/UBC family protein, partial [Campylobacter fetus subsp. venerealis]
KKDFPISIPVIYLSEDDYKSIKYIPHVDDRRNICLFDQENLKLDTSRPTEIVRICLKKAARIISDGINGVNTSDFRDEVVAYWTNVYHTSDRV